MKVSVLSHYHPITPALAARDALFELILEIGRLEHEGLARRQVELPTQRNHALLELELV